ncbi:hypothetical protein DOZ80_03060 [Pseudomonas fluorescens]|uniref:Uncharacterized protein n=1 Tax=Pseudomonas fluorescens TaxID=294 RepID=A0A327NEH8_PSEFL|nr:hypothetical protein [Pseudomonas fluorescens]RAI72534.1 hypothetical protein DOZ80_03060 [Pseudomonas fluorescens]
MTQSPYEQYSNVLLSDNYGTARILQSYVLYQFRSGQFPFDINQHLGGFDTRHLGIYNELKQWYWENGPGPGFYEIVDVIIAKRNAAALDCVCELAKLRSMDPDSYPSEDGQTPAEAYKSALHLCEVYRKEWGAKGFPLE